MKNKFKSMMLIILAVPLFWYGCQDDMNNFDQHMSSDSIDSRSINSTNTEICGTLSWDLTAGQNIDIGSVVVENDADQIYVTYTIDVNNFPYACFGSLHAWIGTDLKDLPKGGKKRPSPGQLCKYTAGDCSDVQGLTTYTFTIPFSDLGIMDIDAVCDQKLYVVTHAEVDMDCDPLTTDDQETAFGGQIKGMGSAWWYYDEYLICCNTFCIEDAVLLATENNHPSLGDTKMEARIWKINPTNGSMVLISDEEAPINGDPKTNFPSNPIGDNFNGNAWDSENSRFYFSEFGTFKRYGENPAPSKLYFNDLVGNQTYAGQLLGSVGGGTYHEGYYYFISQRTNDLIKVSFNPNGTVFKETKVADLFNNNFNVGLGDIAIDSDGTIYGSATIIGGSWDAIFFKVDMDGSNYQLIKSGGLYGAGGTQIAFGADGVLYGVNARSPFELFSINKMNGNTTFIVNAPVAFSDLAKGPACQ